jgi:16S rRNA (cytidine1402-2'-O)-methyltransferase
MKGKLYLLPTPINDNDVFESVPNYNKEIIEPLRYFVVEEIRTARRFLRKLCPDFPIDDCTFFVLNEHTCQSAKWEELLQPLLNGNDMGLLSEAGLPCIADPGADFVWAAQQKNIQVVPLVGPSSITMALMASGLHGQQFAFHGYLPTDKTALADKLRKLENSSIQNNQTQLFMETPYRNNQLFDILLKTCRPDTRLCIACNISGKDEYIKTQSIAKWKNSPPPSLHKKPTVFAILG